MWISENFRAGGALGLALQTESFCLRSSRGKRKRGFIQSSWPHDETDETLLNVIKAILNGIQSPTGRLPSELCCWRNS